MRVLIDQTFINELAAGTPTPGGGGASAYCGALGSALSSMVEEVMSGVVELKVPLLVDVQSGMNWAQAH